MNLVTWIVYARKQIGDVFEEVGKFKEEPNKEEWLDKYKEVKICKLTVTRSDYKREWQ